MNEAPLDRTDVAGERPRRSPDAATSVHTRVSNLLPIGLTCVLGMGLLVWYYANALARPGRARRSAEAAVAQKLQGEAALPSLGRIVAPVAASAPESSSPERTDPSAASALDANPASAVDLPEIALATAAPLAATATAPAPAAASTRPALAPGERRLTGAAYARATMGAGAEASAPGVRPGGEAAPPPARTQAVAEGRGSLAPLLRGVVEPGVQARRLPLQRLIVPKGAFIDCTLETAIDSTLPGMTTCITATDVFGGDGTVVLLERGTKLIGETRGEVQQGAARVFVLWTEARTPAGVAVDLSSPGADELGRSGLPGDVDRHFWQRFGAAMLVSVIEGAVQAAVQSSSSTPGAVIVNPSTSQDVLTEVLKGTINIPPTVRKRNGDRIQVLVARDLDFRSVYALLPAEGR